MDEFKLPSTPITDHPGGPSGKADNVVLAELVEPPSGGWSPFQLVSIGISWIIILGLVSVTVILNSIPVSDDEAAAQPSMELLQINWLGKTLVASREFAGQTPDWEMASGPLAGDTVDGRLGLAILTNEFNTARAAAAVLHSHEWQELSLQASPDQQRVRQLLLTLFRDYQRDQFGAPSMTEEDREFLVSQLGWCGELALHPRQSPDRDGRSGVIASSVLALVVTGVMFLIFAGLVIFGFIGGIAAAIGVLSKRFLMRFETQHGSGHIYAETFAIWFILFVVLSSVGSIFDLGRYQLFAVGVAFALSLMALIWPIVRGIPAGEVARAIGWTRGRGLFVELIAGVAGYVCCFPIILAGIIVVIMAAMLAGVSAFAPLGWLQAQPERPSHPLANELLTGDPMVIFGAFLLACVCAPIIEETVFRGVLYRHLRAFSGATVRLLSVLFSAGVNSIVFAIIHPQGLLVVPALAALGFSFSLVREWRDSLIAPMTMHALHNGVLVGAFVLLFSV